MDPKFLPALLSQVRVYIRCTQEAVTHIDACFMFSGTPLDLTNRGMKMQFLCFIKCDCIMSKTGAAAALPPS